MNVVCCYNYDYYCVHTIGLEFQINVSLYHSIKAAIGEGNFGSVSRGVWLPPDGRHEVAVKMLKPGAGEEDRVKLLQEAAIMGQFVHKNVVSLHGVVTLGEPVSICVYVCTVVRMHFFEFFLW